MPGKSVTLFGANGTLGSKILEALVSAEAFDVSVVRRASSSSVPAFNSVKILEVPDNLPLEALKNALSGQDAVIASFPLRSLDDHLRLAEAAALAGVKRFIPADFGSCDAASPRAQELVELYKDKTRVRQRCEELAQEYPTFTWTALVVGHFFDWGLEEGFLHADIKKRSIDILDKGDYKASASTLSRIGDAVVRVLQQEEVTENERLFIQSFCVSQLEILASLEKATGSSWSVNHLDSNKFIDEQKALSDTGNRHAIEELVFVLGTVDANWETRDSFAMKILSLEDENLDEVVARVVAKVDGSAS